MLDYAALAALRAVLRSGSFDAGAAHLGVTPSAISQRIKGLEEAMGAPLVIRSQPTRATALGARLARHAEDVAAMEHALLDDRDAQPPTLRIATPADVLSTWLPRALSRAGDLLFDLVIDDQDHSTNWLKQGEVAAAITSRAEAVQGCDVRPLGRMRYIASASPEFIARWFPDGLTAQAAGRAPMLRFNEKDRLQDQWLYERLGQRVTPPCHRLPSSHGFALAAEAGLGWGMNPADKISEALAAGRLVALDPAPLDIDLHWQTARASARALAPASQAIRDTARRWLI